MRLLLPILILSVSLTSCASFAGLGGKAHYVQSFKDTEGSVVADNGQVIPGQSTEYNLDIKGPAGMKWEEITSMSYKWNQTDGAIAVNSASKADTIATAEAIKEVVPSLAASIGGAVTNAILEALNAYLPYDLQKTQIKADAGLQDTQLKVDAIKDVTKIVVPKQPSVITAPPAEPTTNDVVPVAPPLGPVVP